MDAYLAVAIARLEKTKIRVGRDRCRYTISLIDIALL